ncbi:hypothetical protein Aperf_G00000100731 [Anoplocephala perfoliata]
MKIVLSITLVGVVMSLYAQPNENLAGFKRTSGVLESVVDALTLRIPAQEKIRNFDYDCEAMIKMISTFTDIPDKYILLIKEDPRVMLELLRAQPDILKGFVKLIEDLLNFCINTTVFEKFVTDRDGPVMRFIGKLSTTPTTTTEVANRTQAPVSTVTSIFTPEQLNRLRLKIPNIDILLAKVGPGKIGSVLQFAPNLLGKVESLHERVLRFININAELIGEMLNRFNYE